MTEWNSSTTELYERMTKFEQRSATAQYAIRARRLDRRHPERVAFNHRLATASAYRFAALNSARAGAFPFCGGGVMTSASHGRLTLLIPGIVVTVIGALVIVWSYFRLWEVNKYLRSKRIWPMSVLRADAEPPTPPDPAS